ncbi:MAG: DUF4292 domain-containing protein, partial [Bacteroidaceae bacterium]|nr:DUF4292 domain-containing protein [Bacteroidaceae bacterium]
KESYKDIPFFAQAGINFYTFQSLFWDELFVLGSRGDVPLETMFTKTIDKDLAVLRNDDSKSANLTFYANLLSGLIRRTNICSKDETQTPALNWEYVSFTRLGTSEFPSKMEMELTGTSIPLSATLTLAKVQANDEWEKRTEVSKKRFTQISIQEAFSRIFAITY